MIIKRKLFSKTSKEKREMAADNLDRTRKGVATIYGGLVGAGIGSATGAAIATAGHLHHKSEARKAREELKRRGKE